MVHFRFDTLLGLGILFVWIVLVLFAQNWLTQTKFWCLLGFAVLVGIYMFGEGVWGSLFLFVCLFVCLFLNGLLTFVSAEQQTDETYARWSDWFDKKRTNKKTYAEHVKLGPGFAKTIWRWSRWSSYVGIAITLVLFAVFFGAILWDAVVDFGLSVLFLLCSLAALAYVMYHNHTRAQNWILFLW
jgi:hypothetical protein